MTRLVPVGLVLALAASVALLVVFARAWRARSRAKTAPFIRARQRTFPAVHSTVRVTRDTWRNWSRELVSKPQRLYSDVARNGLASPRSLADLQRIVREARSVGATVRAFGSSHSWALLVPADGGFLVDNRMIGAVGDRYEVSLEPPSADGTRKARATVPPGIISEEFERWLWDMGYTLPASAFEDCFTMGGMAATSTHGVGLDIPTVSDMVVGAVFVDGLGEVRNWSRETATPDELAAVQCGLGCLGLVYSLTFEVEPRYEVESHTRLVPFDSVFGDNDEARARLRAIHEEHTSVEFFWWPFVYSGIPIFSKPAINPDVWILSTKKVIAKDVKHRTATRRWLHFNILDLPTMVLQGYLTRFLVKHPKLVCLIACSVAFSGIWVKARSGRHVMPQYDANHYVNAAGVEWILCTAVEWSIPFRPAASDASTEGWERVRRSFALMRDAVRDEFAKYHWTDPRATPITIALEMRTLAPSTALLSPGYQPASEHGAVRYAAPEIVTVQGHPAWKAFAHRINEALTADVEGFGDQVRPHLAKECRSYPHPDFPENGMSDYMREQYIAAGTWHRFLAVREQVDPDGVFMNDFLRSWFEGQPTAARASGTYVVDKVAVQGEIALANEREAGRRAAG